MVKLKLLLVTTFLVLAFCKYEIIDNQASRNVFHSDRQSTPVLGPLPKNISSGREEVRFHECAFQWKYSHKELVNIIDIYEDVIFGKGYLSRCPRNKQINVMKYLTEGRKLIEVDIRYNPKDRSLDPKGFNTDHEKYEVNVGNDGKITISADYYPGIIRAIDSIAQLIERNEDKEGDYRIKFAPISIKDKPSYAYRGIMLDTSREYYYPAAIKQLLDGMMIARLNVFHWHFMDSDSMPMYSESFPNLTDYTAFRKEEIYTKEMVKDIVKHARVRGIKVIPEIEGPANVNALSYYPEFRDSIDCARGKDDKNYRHGLPPKGAWQPNSNITYNFLEKFMRDIKDSFDAEFYHLGGDHPDGNCWAKEKNKDESYEKYVKKERQILYNLNSSATAMYWYNNERLDYNNADILQYKGRSRNIETEMATEPHNYFVLSPEETMIVDCGFPDWTGSRSKCYGTKSWRDYWNYNPDTYNKKGKNLGFEILAWSHMSNEFDFLTKIFPRAAVTGFKHWNPNGLNGGALIETMMRFQYRVKSYGVPTEKISMRYCEEHTHHCFGI